MIFSCFLLRCSAFFPTYFILSYFHIFSFFFCLFFVFCQGRKFLPPTLVKVSFFFFGLVFLLSVFFLSFFLDSHGHRTSGQRACVLRCYSTTILLFWRSICSSVFQLFVLVGHTFSHQGFFFGFILIFFGWREFVVLTSVSFGFVGISTILPTLLHYEQKQSKR